MEKSSKIKFLDVKKEFIKSDTVKVNDLTVKDNHSYVVGLDNKIVHNCTTYQNTAFGSRGHQASTVKEICDISTVPVIADGGIRQNGDINVSLAMGAKMVMIGGMLSAFRDSPGNIITQNNIQYKEFWGSASQYQSNKTNRIEGTKILKVMKNKNLIDELISIEESIQSGISYAGGTDLNSFKNVDFIIL